MSFGSQLFGSANTNKKHVQVPLHVWTHRIVLWFEREETCCNEPKTKIGDMAFINFSYTENVWFASNITHWLGDIEECLFFEICEEFIRCQLFGLYAVPSLAWLQCRARLTRNTKQIHISENCVLKQIQLDGFWIWKFCVSSSACSYLANGAPWSSRALQDVIEFAWRRGSGRGGVERGWVGDRRGGRGVRSIVLVYLFQSDF